MRRLGLCTLAVVILVGALAFRVAQLLVLSGDRYRTMALDQRLRTIPEPAARGSIFDRNGRDLALSVDRSTVYADPRLVTDPAMYASKLSPVVGVDTNTLVRRLSDRKRRFVYVARTVEDDVAAKVRTLGLPGVSLMTEPKRMYPAGSVAAALVGRVGHDGNGLDGLEAQYEAYLKGTPGEIVVERDQHGHEIPDTQRRNVAAKPGNDLVLTIDEALQYQVEQSLVDQVTYTGATRGMAIIVDVHSGDVVAMATVEGGATGKPRPAIAGDVNAPLVNVFQPGSTMKVVTISRALDLGIVGPQTPFNVPAHYAVGTHLYSDVHSLAEMETWSTAQILQESSNVGTIMIAQHMTPQQLGDGIRAFGFGSKTSISYPAQPAGFVIEPDKYYDTGLASSAIGTAEGVTAMQMVDVYATLANGGVTVPPRLVSAMIDGSGKHVDMPAPAGNRVVSDATAQTMSEMMQGVVRSGTGACASVQGYSVAGKTGTSNQALRTGGWSDTTFASFAGFAPAEAPRFAAIVVLDAPQTTQFGARAAAPVFSEIMQAALRQYRVAPTDLGDQNQYAAARAQAAVDAMDCTVPHGQTLTNILAQRAAAAATAATSTTTVPAAAPTTLPADTSQGQ
jgi:cell division protein FtsI (penicillin-binding protein 3)